MIADHDFVVPARKWAEIGGIADNVRTRLGLWYEPRLPVTELLEQVVDQRFGWFRLEVADHAEMEGVDGCTCPKGEFIRLREDVYGGAGRASLPPMNWGTGRCTPTSRSPAPGGKMAPRRSAWPSHRPTTLPLKY